MTNRGDKNKSALLVIDVQNGVVASGWNKDQVIANVARLVDHARKSDVPVIWIQHQAEDMPRDSEEWQWVPELVPNDGEIRVYKEYSDSFAATDLPQILEDLGVGHLVVAGAQTNACIRATTYRAIGEGYDVTLVGDAHTTEDISWDGIDLNAESMINDLNLTFQFVEWPGQSVSTKLTEDILAL